MQAHSTLFSHCSYNLHKQVVNMKLEFKEHFQLVHQEHPTLYETMHCEFGKHKNEYLKSKDK